MSEIQISRVQEAIIDDLTNAMIEMVDKAVLRLRASGADGEVCAVGTLNALAVNVARLYVVAAPDPRTAPPNTFLQTFVDGINFHIARLQTCDGPRAH